jgi:hypothetical protein
MVGKLPIPIEQQFSEGSIWIARIKGTGIFKEEVQ